MIKQNKKEKIITLSIFSIVLLLLSGFVFAVPLDSTNINQLSPHQKNIVQQQIDAGRDISEFQLTASQFGGFLLTDTINRHIFTSEGHVSGSLPSTIQALTINNFNPATAPNNVVQATPAVGSSVPEGWSIRSINGQNYLIKDEALEFHSENPKAAWDDSRKSFVVIADGEFDVINHGATELLQKERRETAFNALTADVTTTTETSVFSVDDKKAHRKGSQLSKEKSVVTVNSANVKLSETKFVISQKDFSEKGSIEIIYTNGVRSQTSIKDQSNALFSIDDQGSINGLITTGLLSPKEALDAISDPVLKEAVRQDMLGNSNIKEGRWDIFSASEKFGAVFKAYNEFKGLATLTSLLSDNYDEYVSRRREYLNNRFCIFAGIGNCLKSEICEGRILHSGGNALIGTTSTGPNLGVASVRGEKSSLINTPQGTGFVYKVQYHLENPNNKDMSYNVWFESSSLRKQWYKDDKKLLAFQKISSFPTDKDGLVRLSYNDYDKVCIRFSPGIYKFNSRSKISEHCDVLTKDYDAPSQEESKVIQQAVTGKDGDI